MMRSDLLALSEDDLAALTNRGTVKRALRELDNGQPSYRLDVDGKELRFHWSDGTICTFPAGQTIHEARCSSGIPGISRHLIRSVLAYQRQRESDSQEVQRDAGWQLDAVWNPGDISDEQLCQHFRPAAVTRARELYERGVLAEVTRGAKPTVRFLHESCTVRFPVPQDIRYATADCQQSLWSRWIPAAVWACRDFRHDRLAGLLETHTSEFPVPEHELQQLDVLQRELLRDGIAQLSETWLHRARRLETMLRDADLVWPAEELRKLAQQVECYQLHDARFDPASVVQLLGSLTARGRAISRGCNAVPQLLIRGSRHETGLAMRSSRMMGVGLGVEVSSRQIYLHAFLQDAESGAVVCLERSFRSGDSDAESTHKPLSELVAFPLARGISIGRVALSQLLLSSGKRTPTDELVLPRGADKVTVNPQTFQWEQLKPPFAAERFSQLRQRFEDLPPDCLRPCRRTENLHVIAIREIRDVRFDAIEQRMSATAIDQTGETATLTLPYHRCAGREFDEFLNRLTQEGAQAKFVSGHCRLRSGEIFIEPICVVLEQMGHRHGMSPWLPSRASQTSKPTEERFATTGSRHPIGEFQEQWLLALIESCMAGNLRVDPQLWEDIHQQGGEVGFSRLLRPVARLIHELHQRQQIRHWNSTTAENTLRELCLLFVVGQQTAFNSV